MFVCVYQALNFRLVRTSRRTVKHSYFGRPGVPVAVIRGDIVQLSYVLVETCLCIGVVELRGNNNSQCAFSFTDELDGRKQSCHVDIFKYLDHARVVIFIPDDRKVVYLRKRQWRTDYVQPFDRAKNRVVSSTSEMPYRVRLVVKTRNKRGIGGCVHRDSNFVSVSVSFVHGGIAFGNSAGQVLLLHTAQRIFLA